VNIATFMIIPCLLAGWACDRPDLLIMPQTRFYSLPFWTMAGVLYLIAVMLLATIGGRRARLAIILILATPLIFIGGKLMIGGVYSFHWLTKGKHNAKGLV
jgi:hypothetical protein